VGLDSQAHLRTLGETNVFAFRRDARPEPYARSAQPSISDRLQH